MQYSVRVKQMIARTIRNVRFRAQHRTRRKLERQHMRWMSMPVHQNATLWEYRCVVMIFITKATRTCSQSLGHDANHAPLCASDIWPGWSSSASRVSINERRASDHCCLGGRHVEARTLYKIRARWLRVEKDVRRLAIAMVFPCYVAASTG